MYGELKALGWGGVGWGGPPHMCVMCECVFGGVALGLLCLGILLHLLVEHAPCVTHMHAYIHGDKQAGTADRLRASAPACPRRCANVAKDALEKRFKARQAEVYAHNREAAAAAKAALEAQGGCLLSVADFMHVGPGSCRWRLLAQSAPLSRCAVACCLLSAAAAALGGAMIILAGCSS